MKSKLLILLLALPLGLLGKSYELIIVDNSNKALEAIPVKIQSDNNKTINTLKSDKYGKVEINDENGVRVLVDAKGYKSRLIEFENLDTKQTVRLHKMRDYSAKEYMKELFQEDVNYVEIKGDGEKKQITFPKRPSQDAVLKSDWKRGYYWAREVEVQFDDDEVPVLPDNSDNSHLKSKSIEFEEGKGALVGYIIDDSSTYGIRYANIELNNNKESFSSNHIGFFNESIEPGTYNIKITASGYDSYVINNIKIRANGVKKKSLRLMRNENYKDIYYLNKDSDRRFRDGADPLEPRMKKAYGSRAEATSISAERIVTLESDADAVELDIRPTKDIKNPKASAGKLTAGILNDFQKWELWNDLTKENLEEYEKFWQISPRKRYSVIISNELNNPVIGAKVDLVNEDGEAVWSTISDNLGKAELWSEIYGEKDANYYEIKISYNGKTETIEDVKEFHDGINTIKIDAECEIPEDYDISFVIDATGSMGDEIEFLKAELYDIIERSKSELPNVNINMSTMFYRDNSDDYLIRKMDFTDKISRNIDFIKLNQAGGGGDYPEAVDAAFESALNLNWNENTVNKLIFFLLDAPPHEKPENIQKLQKITKKATENGIRVVPVACSGTNKSTEYLMRSIALATGGKYIFLTDDSGIGGAHLKPSTDNYEVLTLNEILFNTIIEFGKTDKCEVAQISDQQEEITYNPDYLDDFSTEENSEIESWTVYPNPARDFIQIKAEGELNQVFIGDMRGNILERISANGVRELRIDLRKYPNGSYMIMSEYAPGKWMSTRILLNR